jgi:outer membrane protein OmpA-like peptidoglycan-associated protein
MRHLVCITLFTLALLACGGDKASSPAAAEPVAPSEAAGGEAAAAPASEAEGGAAAAPGTDPNEQSEFVLRKSEAAKDTPRPASNIKPTHSEAAMKFTVVDKDKGPVRGIVISLTGADGKKYYTAETSTDGYAEVLVPVGQKYELVYLSLGRKDIAAEVNVTNEPNQNVRLTLRYKRYVPPPDAPPEPVFVLDGVNFDTAKATIRPESFPRLDAVVEYMTYKTSSRIQISGHTDNQGNPKSNKTLSQKRAEACRDYLAKHGIDKSRVEALGFGDEQPIASNDTEEGRRLNRRIEAKEL